jgi:hypothetical protein
LVLVGLGLGWVVAGGVYGQSHESLAVLVGEDGARLPAPAWYQLFFGMVGVLPYYLRVVAAGLGAAFGLYTLNTLGAWWSARERSRRDAELGEAATLDASRWAEAQVARDPAEEPAADGRPEGTRIDRPGV